ncbi:hypothetical protein K377_06114 [Streptomyces sp. PsTaAH-137]|nr:hypothetical protein K377_06114 [Streptomyces sp. PsTaAH-137]
MVCTPVLTGLPGRLGLEAVSLACGLEPPQAVRDTQSVHHVDEASFRTLNVRNWDRMVAAWAAADDDVVDTV